MEYAYIVLVSKRLYHYMKQGNLVFLIMMNRVHFRRDRTKVSIPKYW